MRERTSAWFRAGPALVVTLGLFGGALAGAVRMSLHPDPLTGPASLSAWRSLLADRVFTDAVVFTVAVAVATTVLAAGLAVPVAAAIRRRPFVRAVTTLPVLLPHLLVAAVAVLWLAPGGLADRLLGGLPIDVIRARSGLGIVIVYLAKEVPFLVLLVAAAWDDTVEGREEAAAVHGAGRLARWWHVVIPAVRTPLFVGGLLVAAFVLGSFEVPLVVGPTAPDTIATYALRATRVADLSGQAIAAAALLVATAGALLLSIAVGLALRRRDD